MKHADPRCDQDRPPTKKRKKGDVSTATTLMRRMAISRAKSKPSVEPKIRKKRQCRNRCMIPATALVVSTRRAHYYDVEIFFQDAEADVQYVWIISFPSRKRASILPHPHQVVSACFCLFRPAVTAAIGAHGGELLRLVQGAL